MLKLKNYINGELVEPISGQYLDNIEPATGQVYSLIPDSDNQDVEQAYLAANEAFKTWSVSSAQNRCQILLKISQLIERNMHELAAAESQDNGKPLQLATSVDIPRARDNFSFFATAILHDHNESHPTDNNYLNYTWRQPAGIAGCISPWNLPLYLFSWKIAPALAAGCTVVAKPSEVTPYTAYLLSELCIEAGLPAGVLNIVHGTGPRVGGAITAHPKINVISFTGGTKTGQEIARTAAPMFKKLSLELGGKNPNIIFADCDWDSMMKTTLHSSFANQGQICLCGSRILIERSIYEKFKVEFIQRVSQLTVGDPNEETTKIGALSSEAHTLKVLSYIELAKQEGGDVLTGGNRMTIPGRCEAGYFIQPTVIEGLDQNCRVNQEEIFGPVVTLQAFDNEDDAIQNANSTEYGLAATIWTNNLQQAHRVSHSIHSGIIWVNCWLIRDLRTLFGGMKQSGVGREGGYEALHFFTEPKNICIKL
ncbi:MAG: aldehyde dehydrogenase [Bacteroidota bacterium]|nr:aldehyde dehydrogenase [Bacteroidota bacterium]